MLKFSGDLYTKINEKIKYVVIGENYKIVGSFGKNKYVTDIDVTNYVNNIDFDKEIKKIINRLPKDILFLNFTSGFIEKFAVPWKIIDDKNVERYDYVKSINFINELYFDKYITEKERDYCNNLLTENPEISKLALIEDKLYIKSKQKFSKSDIMERNLSEEFNDNKYNVLHFIYKYDKWFIPIDVGLVSGKVVRPEFDMVKYLMFVKKEYYFILCCMKYHLNKFDADKANGIINDYGAYRQILMDIFYLKIFIDYPIINKKEYGELIMNVMDKIKNHTTFKSNIMDQILKCDDNMKLYDLLSELENDLTKYLNMQFEKYAYEYYRKVYEFHKMTYDYLAFDMNKIK